MPALRDKTFAVTGMFNNSQRSAVLKEIEQSGGKVGSSVDLNTDYLIAGEKASSSNLDSAKQFGVPIISLDDLRRMIRTTELHDN